MVLRVAYRIRYSSIESNNLDESQVIGIDDDSYLEYENHREFFDWILALKPKDVKDKGISERRLKRKKTEIGKGKMLNPKTKIVKIPLQLYKECKSNSKE